MIASAHKPAGKSYKGFEKQDIKLHIAWPLTSKELDLQSGHVQLAPMRVHTKIRLWMLLIANQRLIISPKEIWELQD